MTTARPLLVLVLVAAALGLTGCALGVSDPAATHGPGQDAGTGAGAGAGSGAGKSPTSDATDAHVDTGDAPGTGSSCDGRSFTVAESNVQLALDGDCGDIVIQGDSVSLALDGARSLKVTGSDGTIVAQHAFQSADVEGDGNSVTGDVGDLRVGGDGNLVLMNQAGTIAVGGSSNTVTWSTGGAAPQDTGSGNQLIHP